MPGCSHLREERSNFLAFRVNAPEELAFSLQGRRRRRVCMCVSSCVRVDSDPATARLAAVI